MTKVVYFDLFFTIIVPCYKDTDNEFDILGLSVYEWEDYAENDSLYEERALGRVDSEMTIIEKITSSMPYHITDDQNKLVLAARENRMKEALHNVSGEVLDTIKELKARGIKVCLISNADLIDSKFWNQSPLAQYFDDVIFSCNVELLKPDKRIYELGMQHMSASPAQCIFVGDGGSDELHGAKNAGMKTIFTEALDVKSGQKKEDIAKYADYHITEFKQILDCL